MRSVPSAPAPRRAMDAVDGLATELSSPAMVARVPMIRKVL